MDAESLQREIDQLTLHVATDSRKLKEMKVRPPRSTQACASPEKAAD